MRRGKRRAAKAAVFRLKFDPAQIQRLSDSYRVRGRYHLYQGRNRDPLALRVAKRICGT